MNKLSKMPDADSSGLFIPTLNRTGYMTTQLDEFSQAFVEHAASIKQPVLEIGAAYGIATKAALSCGAKVVCNDLDPRHLAIIEQQITDDEKSRVKFIAGSFPHEIKFSANTFSAILICRVIHLFDGDTIEYSLQRIYEWLNPSGKLFIIADTPYLKNFSAFIPEYESRVKRGEKWPGLITNTKQYIENITEHFPDFVHVLDENILKRILLQAGFKIEKISTFGRSDYPADRKLDGRECVGGIAYK